jgi:uncharacterized protein (TIGR04255 family)
MVSTTPIPPPLPSFKDPPVIEVSFGIVFQRLIAMQSRHFGQFWVEQRNEYPKTSDANPLLDISEVESQRLVVLSLPPLRRMMCVSENDQFVLQIQDTRVHLNWRKTKSDDRYPRYQNVLTRFEKVSSAFIEFIRRENIGQPQILRYELSYFNHIRLEKDVARSVEDNIKLFQFSPITNSYISPPEAVNAVWRFAMPSQRGTATVTLNNGVDQSSGENLLVLVLTCTGPISESYSATAWYDSAHEWIVRSFTDLTTERAHQLWGRER